MKIVRLVRQVKNKEGNDIITESLFVKVLNKYFPVFIDKGFIKSNDPSIIKEKEVDIKFTGEVIDA